MALTDKQQAFVNHYLTCFNATRAAVAAGYSGNTARSIGQENLTKPDIRAEIDARLKELRMGANEVLARLERHARGDVTEILKPYTLKDKDGNEVKGEDGQPVRDMVLDLHGAAERGALGLVKKVKFGARGDVSIEMYDAQRALITLAQVHRLVGPRDDEEGGDDDGDDEIADIRPEQAEALAQLLRDEANNP